MNFSDSHSGAIEESFREIAHKVAKSKIFQKFELNRNLQRIPFKMMYNMSMLRMVVVVVVGVNHLPLLFRKSVYRDYQASLENDLHEKKNISIR